MNAISKTAPWNVFYWWKHQYFDHSFTVSQLLGFQLTVTHYLSQWSWDNRHIYASLGLSVLFNGDHTIYKINTEVIRQFIKGMHLIAKKTLTSFGDYPGGHVNDCYIYPVYTAFQIFQIYGALLSYFIILVQFNPSLSPTGFDICNCTTSWMTFKMDRNTFFQSFLLKPYICM